MHAGLTGEHIAMPGRLGSGPALGPLVSSFGRPATAVWRTDMAPFEHRSVPECGSTNTELLDHLRRGGGPLLLVAERQTAGRGRLGRAWQSQAGGSLTFSIGQAWPAALDLSGLSLAVGCALADALEPEGQRLGLKWPNDLWLDGAKLGGVLIETVALPGAQRGVVIGVGLNLAPLPEGSDRSAFASGHAPLQALLPGIEPATALARVAPALQRLLAEFANGAGFAPWREAFARRDLACGRRVSVGVGAGSRRGTARGVSASGELLLDEDGRLSTLSGGELSLTFEEAHACAP
jgi:BirA family transcriptional regulator, biotin operon repressor / biotin---[acetyl-CoA-carboxylase] ligase